MQVQGSWGVVSRRCSALDEYEVERNGCVLAGGERDESGEEGKRPRIAARGPERPRSKEHEPQQDPTRTKTREESAKTRVAQAFSPTPTILARPYSGKAESSLESDLLLLD